MTSCSIKITLLIVMGVVAWGQFSTAVETRDKVETSDKTGTISGFVDHAVLRAESAIVYIKDTKRAFPPPKEPVAMDQVKMKFSPKVLPILAGTMVKFPNNDSVEHNVSSPTKSAKVFDFGLLPPGQSKEVVFNKPGVVPVLCNVHPEMSAFIVVLPNPFFSKTELDGTFKIENIPPGKYELSYWHEKLKSKTIDVTVTSGDTTRVKFSGLEKGKYSIEIGK